MIDHVPDCSPFNLKPSQAWGVSQNENAMIVFEFTATQAAVFSAEKYFKIKRSKLDLDLTALRLDLLELSPFQTWDETSKQKHSCLKFLPGKIPQVKEQTGQQQAGFAWSFNIYLIIRPLHWKELVSVIKKKNMVHTALKGKCPNATSFSWTWNIYFPLDLTCPYFDFILLLFVWIPISFHKVAASLSGVHSQINIKNLKSHNINET